MSLFTDAQMREGRDVQDNTCPWCGRTLGNEVVGDHVIPRSQDGATVIGNLWVLHPACHHAKTRILDPARAWQRTAILATDALDTALIQAPMGTGKTRLGMMQFKWFAARNPNALAVIVSPMRSVVRGWASASYEIGVEGVICSKGLGHRERRLPQGEVSDLPRSGIPAHVSVVSLSYQSLPGMVGEIRRQARTRPLFAILDEIHRTEEGGDSVWGQAASDAFEQARKRLLLSGTPYRTNGGRLYGVTYDADDYAIPSYVLPWDVAVNESYISPVTFLARDADGEWERLVLDPETGQVAARIRGEGLISDEDPSTAADAHRNALMDYTGFMPESFRVLISEEEKTRRVYPDSGMLFLALDRNHAREMERLLREMSFSNGQPISVVTALGDDENAHMNIDGFRRGSYDALVAVAMVAEGTDIPRVKSIFYGSLDTAPVGYRQKIGRGIRTVAVDGTETPVPCVVVQPSRPSLTILAEGFMQEQGEQARDTDDALPTLPPTEPAQGPATQFVPGSTDHRRTSDMISADGREGVHLDADLLAEVSGIAVTDAARVLATPGVEITLARPSAQAPEPTASLPSDTDRDVEMTQEYTYLRNWLGAAHNRGAVTTPVAHLVTEAKTQAGTSGEFGSMSLTHKERTLNRLRSIAMASGWRGR